MSQPIRYGLADEHLGRIHPQEDGHLVMWSDYAALAAENERLRKAGDAMMEVLESEIPFTAMNSVNGWLAAKEERDAK